MSPPSLRPIPEPSYDLVKRSLDDVQSVLRQTLSILSMAQRSSLRHQTGLKEMHTALEAHLNSKRASAAVDCDCLMLGPDVTTRVKKTGGFEGAAQFAISSSNSTPPRSAISSSSSGSGSTPCSTYTYHVSPKKEESTTNWCVK